MYVESLIETGVICGPSRGEFNQTPDNRGLAYLDFGLNSTVRNKSRRFGRGVVDDLRKITGKWQICSVS